MPMVSCTRDSFHDIAGTGVRNQRYEYPKRQTHSMLGQQIRSCVLCLFSLIDARTLDVFGKGTRLRQNMS